MGGGGGGGGLEGTLIALLGKLYTAAHSDVSNRTPAASSRDLDLVHLLVDPPITSFDCRLARY